MIAPAREILPLWKHQRECVSKALQFTEYALFMDLGTGKTATTINILRSLYTHHGRVLRTLIFCPIVVVENWKREFGVHSKIAQKVITLKGSSKAREALMAEALSTHKDGCVFVTNFEAVQMKGLYKSLATWEPETIIVDESQRLRNYKAIRTKLITALGDKADYRYILSGTPILNTPMDVFGQYRFLDKGATFDKNFFAFRARYFYDKNAGMPSHKHFPNWQPRSGIDEVFHEKIYEKAMRVLKADCMDLPPLVRKVIGAELSPEQEKAYHSMRKHFIAYISDKACVATIALTKALRMQQIVSGFFIDDEGVATHFADVPRLKALEETLLMLPPKAKVIIWAAFKENYRAIEGVLSGLGEWWRYVHLVGGLSDKKRVENIDSFQNDPEVRVLIGNQQAGGVGINLVAASYMIYFSKNFSLESDLQSEARCHRGGSEIHSSITRIDLVTPGTIDELISEALSKKESMAENILGIGGKI